MSRNPLCEVWLPCISHAVLCAIAVLLGLLLSGCDNPRVMKCPDCGWMVGIIQPDAVCDIDRCKRCGELLQLHREMSDEEWAKSEARGYVSEFEDGVAFTIKREVTIE